MRANVNNKNLILAFALFTASVSSSLSAQAAGIGLGAAASLKAKLEANNECTTGKKPGVLNSLVQAVGYYNPVSDEIPLVEVQRVGNPINTTTGFLRRERLVQSKQGKKQLHRLSATTERISPCLYLAPAHAVFFDGEKESTDVSVTIETMNAEGIYTKSLAKPIAYGEFNRTQLDNQDYVVLKSVKCSDVWRKIAAPKKTNNHYIGTQVACNGFPATKDTRILWGDSKKFIAEVNDLQSKGRPGTLVNSCGTESGFSGGPLFTDDDKKELLGMQIVSLREGVTNDSSDQAVSLALDVRALTPVLNPLINADIEAYMARVSASQMAGKRLTGL